MEWGDILKNSAGLYHPISAVHDGFFYKIVFEDDDGENMGDDLIMHLKYRNWQENENFSTKLYEVHLGINPKLQGMGNAEKMIVGAVIDKNEVLSPVPLYINYYRVLNPRVMSVVEKLKNNSMIETREVEIKGEPAGLLMSTNYEAMGE